MFSFGNDGSPIAANDGKLFLLSGNRPEQKLIAFDGITGNELWRVGITGDIVVASPSTVFVADCSVISALDVSTGEKLWDKSYVKWRGDPCINSMVTDGNKLYVFELNHLVVVLNAQNGDELIKEAYSDNSLAKVAIETGIPVVIDLSFYQGNILYRREGWYMSYGPISAVNLNLNDINNYDIAWHSSYDYASNIAPAQNGMFALTANGQVLYLDSKNGNPNQVVSFTPAELNFTIDEGCGYKVPYYVKFDSATNMLFVVLGDSNRLYAFQLK
jgi:outer membrane protein assembly factor BamB